MITRPPGMPRVRRRRHRLAGARPVMPPPSARSALATAVALLTVRLLCPDDVTREDVLAGEDPAAVLAVMEVIAADALRTAWPEDGGAELLGRIGLAFADLGEGGAA